MEMLTFCPSLDGANQLALLDRRARLALIMLLLLWTGCSREHENIWVYDVTHDRGYDATVIIEDT